MDGGTHEKDLSIGSKALILSWMCLTVQGQTHPRQTGKSSSDGQIFTDDVQPRIQALKLDEMASGVQYADSGEISILDGSQVTLLFVGVNFDGVFKYKLTTSKGERGDECGKGEGLFKGPFEATEVEKGVWKGESPEQKLSYYLDQEEYFICVLDNGTGLYHHQGQSKHLKMIVYKSFLPFSLMGVFVVILLLLSGMFSGLNLGLMALDQTELRIVMNTGTDVEKSYARSIMPIRNMGNFLLCSLLLGNVLVNNTLTIFLDKLTGSGGIVTIIGSTLGIVVFGEIIPQAVCSRYGLAVGAKTIYLTKFLMVLTSPLSWPISKLLDKVLGSEIGTVYNKERLVELLKVTDEYNDLEKDEVDIVTGALVLKQKTVCDVMTELQDCFLLPIDTVLNFETLCLIKDQGYSRIPVYDGDRGNIVHILFTKDLLFIDPEDNKPIAQVCDFYKNEVNIVFDDLKLNDMLNDFKSGEKGHMAMVRKVNQQGEGDPFYETIGLVTLEDVIEEIIQQEIIDETDIIMDNKSKNKRKRYTKEAEFNLFIGNDKHFKVSITPQMNMAVFQYLTTSVPSFNPSIISAHFLHKILNLDVFREVKLKKDTDPANIMTKGKPCEYFVLILEGKVQLQIGKENQEFEAGPFTFYGKPVLEQALLTPSSPVVTSDAGGHGKRPSLSMHSAVNQEGTSPLIGQRQTISLHSFDTAAAKTAAVWIPDYSLAPLTDILYLEIRRKTYLSAVKATKMHKIHSQSEGFNDSEIDSNLELSEIF